MMERRRALTIPFTVDKEKMMENPLRIPMTCLSSDCGKLEGQVSWTAFAGCKFRTCNPHHKNGSMMFDHHNHGPIIPLEMDRRKPVLILTDVLKTELGKAYMEKLENIGTMSDREQLTSPRRERGRCREEPPLTCRDARSSQNQETINNRSKSVTPKSNQKTTPSSSSQRSRLRRKLQNADEEEDNDESEDIEEVILGRDSGEENKFAEVVDCGLSLSWEHDKDAAGCNEFCQDSIKHRLSDPEKDAQHSLRKRKGSVSQFNGGSSPKRHRESVLRFTIEGEGAGGPTPTSISQEDGEEEIDMENLGRCIVQFTVGEDDQMEALVPVPTPSLEVGDIISNQRRSLLSREDSATQTSPTEPIVLSSDDDDDDENGDNSKHRSRVVRAPVTEEDGVVQGKSSLEAVSEQQEAPDGQDMQILQLNVEEAPCSAPASPVHHMHYSCMSVAFCTLHYGGYQGRANGGLMIAENQIIIPLKGSSKKLDVMLTFERKELRRYSIWEQEELEERLIRFEGDEKPSPAAVLLFYVSETAAAAMQQDLWQLCIKEDGAVNTEKASPFVLLTLRDPLVGMEGALLRSVLELDCINNLAHAQNFAAQGEDRVSGLEHISTPFLSLDESVELIERTGLDSHLLVMLSVKSTDPELNTDWGGSHSDVDEIPTAHIWVDPDLEKESDLELETAPKEDTETQPELKEDQKEEERDNPPESRKEEAKPIYTLRRHRTKGSYSVSLSKPDSKWIKYKHQGLTSRLIQFPPPPLKGGITVTMEDLQCLDSGQYLNDVIIDFYLKYLIQNASAVVAERSHIFSSFFYKQLTRRDNASEGGSSDSCQRQRRHQRVKTWTRHVDIFKKDFLFVPVNQEAHWYLVVICFPGLEEPKCEAWIGESPSEDETQGCKISNGDEGTPPTLNPSDSGDTETENPPEESTKDPPPCPVGCTERTCKRKRVCKRINRAHTHKHESVVDSAVV